MLAALLNKYVCDIRASREWGIRRKRRSWCYFLNWTMFWACCFHPIWVFFLFPCVKVNNLSGGMRTSLRRSHLCFMVGKRASSAASVENKEKNENQRSTRQFENMPLCCTAAALRTVLISSLLWLLYPVHENSSIPQRLLDSKKIIPDKREEQNTRTESQRSDDWN